MPTKRDQLARAVRHRHLGALRDDDPNPPVAHVGDRGAEALLPPALTPSMPQPLPPRGESRAVHSGTAAGSPAAAPERVGTEIPRHPDTALGGNEVSQLTPARLVDTSRLRRRHPRPLVPRPQPSDVATRRPRPGRKTRRLLPVFPQAAPTTAKLRTSELPTRCPRLDHGRSRAPPASTSRACASKSTGRLRRCSSARHLVSPSHPILRDRPRRRRRQHDQLHGSALRRRIRTTLVSRSSPTAPEQAPTGRLVTRTEVRDSIGNEAAKEALCPMTDILTAVLPLRGYTISTKTQVRSPPFGRTRAASRETMQALSQPAVTRRTRVVLPPPRDRETPRARRPAQPEATSRARTDTTHTVLRKRTTSLPLERSRHLARPILPPKRRDRAWLGTTMPPSVATEGRAPSDDIAARNERALNKRSRRRCPISRVGSPDGRNR